MNNEITYLNGDENILDDIKELWEELNQHHIEKSLHFKQNFLDYSFGKRKETLIKPSENGSLFIIIACDNECKVGYCVSSVAANRGEIASIYVKPEYRKHNVGTVLMEKSLEWIKSNDVKEIAVGVSGGNEDVFAFYAKFGFAPKYTLLSYTL